MHQIPGAVTIAQTLGSSPICAIGGPYEFTATTAAVTPAVGTMTYLWTITSQPPSSTLGLTAPTLAVTGLTFTTFPQDGQAKTVTLQCVAQNLATGCSTTGSQTFTVNTTVPVATVVASSTNFCGSGTVVYTIPAVVGATHTWTVNAGTGNVGVHTGTATRGGFNVTSTSFVAGDTIHVTYPSITTTTNDFITWNVDAQTDPAGACLAVLHTSVNVDQYAVPNVSTAPVGLASVTEDRRVTAAPTYAAEDAPGALCLRPTGSENYAVVDLIVPTPMGANDLVFWGWDGTDGIVSEIIIATAVGAPITTFFSPAENTNLWDGGSTSLASGSYRMFVKFVSAGTFRVRQSTENPGLVAPFCAPAGAFSNVITINALPTTPLISGSGYCVNQTPDTVRIANVASYSATDSFAWSFTGGVTGAAIDILGGPVNEAYAVTSWAGNTTSTVTATVTNSATGCSKATAVALTIGAVPSAANVTGDANACAYPSNPTGIAGSSVDLAYAKTYIVPAHNAGDIYSWSLTNAFIARYSIDGGLNWVTPATVGQTLTYTANATQIQAVFFGASPGDIRYTRVDGTTNCLATATGYAVAYVTPAAITLSGAIDFCSSNAGTFALASNTSTAGINYELQRQTNGGAWTTLSSTPGSGAGLNWTLNKSNYLASGSTVDTYTFRVNGINPVGASCTYGPSNSVNVRVTPQPADIPVAVTAAGCTGSSNTVTIGSGASPSQSFVNYTVQVSPAGAGTWTTLGTVAGSGTGAVTLAHTPLPAGAAPTATTPNFEYRVSAVTNPATSTFSTCTTPLTQQPTTLIFALPTNPTVTTSTGSAYCWSTSALNLVTLNLASTQVGVSYDVRSATSGATILGTIVGDGSPMSISIPVNQIQTTNPAAPLSSQIQVTARLTSISAPASACAQVYNGPLLTINPRPNDLLPVSLSPIRVCEGSNLTVTVTGIEANTSYALFVTNAPTPTTWTSVSTTPAISGGNATFTVSAPTIASPNPLQSTPNYQYKVVATYNATTCAVDLQTQPDVTVFDTPVNPNASVTSVPTCWTSSGNVVVRLASTQDGIRYNIKNGGTQIATTLPGAGANIDITIPLTTIIAANPASGSQALSITVDALLVQEGAFTRPVTTTGCLTNYAVTNGTPTVYSTPTEKSFTTTSSICAGGTVTTAVASTDTWTEYRLVRATSAAGPYSAIGAGTYTAGNGGTLNLTDNPPPVWTELLNPTHFYRVEARNNVAIVCTTTMSTTNTTFSYAAITSATGVSVTPSALCASPGTANFTVTLSGLTQAGVTYTVRNPNGTTIGTIEGTGNGFTVTGTFPQSALAGGLTVVGGTSFTLSVEGALSSTSPYNSRPIPAGGCAVVMTATPAIVVNTLPSTVTVTANSTLCLPGNLSITLGNTNAFATYTVDRTTNGGVSWTTVVNNAPYTGAITDNTLTGGDPVNGLAWTYRVTAVNGACTNVQNNVHTVTVYNELIKTYTPTVVGVTGGSTNKVCYEAGNTFKVTLSNSQLGVNYAFKISASTIATVAGTGAAIETNAIAINSVGLTVPGVGNGGVTNFTVSVDASRAAAPSCTVTLNNTAAGKAVEKLPASTNFTVTPAIGCSNDTYTVTVGPVEPYFFVSVSTTGLTSLTSAAQASSQPGWNGGTKTFSYNVSLAGGGPLTSAVTNTWSASGYHATEGATGFCATTLTSTPTNTVFALPTNVTTSAAPSAGCWPLATTVSAANTQDGIVYTLEKSTNGGGTWVTTGLTVNGTGGTVTLAVPYTTVQAAQLAVPVTIDFRLVGRLRSEAAAPYNRAVPASQCATVVGATNVVVNPKPEITVANGFLWTGSATVSNPSFNQTPICAQNNYTVTGPWTPRSYAVSSNTVLNSTQSSTYAWTVLTEETGDILARSGMNTIAPQITWGIYPAAVAAPNITTETLQVIATTSAGCADTAAYNVTINPTLGDAVVTHNLGQEACVYNNWAPARSVFTLGRTATGITGFPAGTTFNWAVTHPRELTNPPTYAIYGLGNTNSLQVEWLQPSTQTGTAADSATVTVTATLPAAWGSCVTTRIFSVFVHTTPTPAFLSGPTAVCPNSTHTYAAVQNAGNTYSWEVVGGTIAGGTGVGSPSSPSLPRASLTTERGRGAEGIGSAISRLALAQ